MTIVTGPPSSVGLRHFDQGVVDTLGAVLLNMPNGQKFYGVDVPGVTGSPTYPEVPSSAPNVRARRYVPIKILTASSVYTPEIMPEIAIRPGEPTPDLERYQTAQKYRWAARGSVKKTVTNSLGTSVSGFTQYEEREAPQPFDITYEFELRAKRRMDSIALLTYVLKIFPPRGGLIRLKDSAGEERTYEAFNEGVANLSELVGYGERMSAYTVTVRVEAELDLGVDEVQDAMTSGLVDLTISTV